MTILEVQLNTNKDGKHVFYAGETIKGTVKIKLDKEKSFRGCYILIYGRAHCSWEETSGDRTKYFNGKEVYINTTKYFFGRRGGNDIKMKCGTHEYNFEFYLPKDLPETFYGKKGFIEYYVKTVLDIPFRVDKEVIVTFTVRRADHISQFPHYERELYEEHFGSDCCFGGILKFNVTLDRSAYPVGKSIPVKIQYENIGGSVVTETNIELHRFVTYTSQSPYEDEKIEKECLVRVIDQNKININETLEMECQLDIPEYLQLTSIGLCKIISIQYYLKVQPVLSSFFPCGDPTIIIPMALGSSIVNKSSVLKAEVLPMPDNVEPCKINIPQCVWKSSDDKYKIAISLVLNDKGDALFKLGDFVKGVVELTIYKPMYIKYCKVNIFGRAFAQWKEGDIQYFGQEPLLNTNVYVFGDENASPVNIAPGVYRYDFKSSLPFLNSGSLKVRHGNILYLASAFLEYPSNTSMAGASQIFTVFKEANLNFVHTNKLEQKVSEEITEMNSDESLEMTVTLPCSGFAIGYRIPVQVKYVNNGRTEIVETRLRLVQKVIYRLEKPDVVARSSVQIMIEVVERGVEKYKNADFMQMLDVPRDLPLTTKSACKILEVEYFLTVTGKIKKSALNTKILNSQGESKDDDIYVEIPIVIGSVPISSCAIPQTDITLNDDLPTAPPEDDGTNMPSSSTNLNSNIGFGPILNKKIGFESVDSPQLPYPQLSSPFPSKFPFPSTSKPPYPQNFACPYPIAPESSSSRNNVQMPQPIGATTSYEPTAQFSMPPYIQNGPSAPVEEDDNLPPSFDEAIKAHAATISEKKH